jgi:hypothetical protein
LLHHHWHEKHLTEAEREHLLREGVATQGMVVHDETVDAERRISRVGISVRFKDAEAIEFSEDVASLYQPAPGSQEAQRLVAVREAAQLRHPERIPHIQLPLSVGERVPVRYDAADRNRIVLDVPALHKHALNDYIKREQRPKAQSPAHKGAATGPPWEVPAHCPNCGAPVDQALASRDRDPSCQFCHQPIPVKPLHA